MNRLSLATFSILALYSFCGWSHADCGCPKPTATCEVCQPCCKHKCKHGRCQQFAPPQFLLLQSAPIALSSQVMLTNPLAVTSVNAANAQLRFNQANVSNTNVNQAVVAAVVQAMQQQRAAQARNSAQAKAAAANASSASQDDCCDELDKRIERINDRINELDQSLLKNAKLTNLHDQMLDDVIEKFDDLKAKYPKK